jgi:anaerobic ribonucleoside-triphosphate reductase activating protein
MYINVKYPFTTSFNDYFDNESLSVIVYIMGCSHGCNGCHNSMFQDFYYDKGTKLFTTKELSNEIEIFAKRNITDKVCLEGGDPLYHQNLHPVKDLLQRLFIKKLKVAIYTGFEIDDVKEMNLENFKFIKCGSFKKELKQEVKKTDDYIQLASKNQEVYDNNFNLLSKNGVLNF